jgi:uncharacterized membrane protein YkvA (DUF1232 family)
MEILSFILGALLIVYGSCLLVLNFLRQLNNYRNRKNKRNGWSSPAPLIAPIIIVLGYFVLPIDFNPIVLIVFLLDADTVLLFLGIPVLLFQLLKHIIQ